LGVLLDCPLAIFNRSKTQQPASHAFPKLDAAPPDSFWIQVRITFQVPAVRLDRTHQIAQAFDSLA
jgi:hypothetical protein